MSDFVPTALARLGFETIAGDTCFGGQASVLYTSTWPTCHHCTLAYMQHLQLPLFLQRLPGSACPCTHTC